jgi:hypothetical protein
MIDSAGAACLKKLHSEGQHPLLFCILCHGQLLAIGRFQTSEAPGGAAYCGPHEIQVMADKGTAITQ